MQTQLKDVKHGAFVMYNGGRYMRVNASRNVVPRDEGKAVLVNAAAGCCCWTRRRSSKRTPELLSSTARGVRPLRKVKETK